MALNMFGKNLAHEEQGGHGGRPTSTDTPSPQKADGGAAESQAGHHHRNPMVPGTQGGPSNDEEVAAKLSAAAAASIEWAARSGVAFDHGKTEAALFHRKKSTSKATLRRGMRCTGPRAGEAARRNTTPERVTIFSDAQAAIKRMASDEPGRGQQYALQTRKHIATLRKARPGITIEIRWCPAHKGIAGNEKANEWAKIAAEEPDTTELCCSEAACRRSCFLVDQQL